MVKIKCPTRRFDRSQISWWHGSTKIQPEGKGGSFRGRVTAKGVLKIPRIQYTDAGTYICKGKFLNNIYIMFLM